MSTLLFETFQSAAPTEEESRLAQDSSRRLAARLGAQTEVQVQILGDKKHPTETLTIPAAALRLLSHILTEMAAGNAVTLTPTQAELTTQQAADLLNVSRPFMVRLLDAGRIPCRKVGTHRRVLFKDLMDFRKQSDELRHKALDDLAALSQELNLYE